MKKVIEFQKKYPTKEEKEAALKAMSNAEIDELISNIQGKMQRAWRIAGKCVQEGYGGLHTGGLIWAIQVGK